MAFFVAIREYGATPLTTKNFQERLQLHIKVTFLIGITLTVVLQFNPAFPFPFSLFYSWGIVALSFGGCQWLLSEVSFFFFLRKWEPGKWTVGRQWPLTFFHFLVGYGVLVLANEAVVPWLYPQFTGVSEEVRTWGLFFRILPLWFFIAFVTFEMEIKKTLAGNLEQARQVNRLLEQRNKENSKTPHGKGGLTSSQQASRASSTSRSLFRIPGKNGAENLDPETISHISVEEHYSRIFVKREQFLEEIEVRLSLKEALQQLPAPPFVQIHRSHVVNLAHVSRIEQSARSYRVFMGERANALPMSRHRVPDVLPLLQEFLSKPG